MDLGFFLLLLALLGWLLMPLMLPMYAVRQQLGALLAADSTTLAPSVTGNILALIVTPFALTENLVPGDFTVATTNGLTAISCATGTQEVGNDPTSGMQIITIVPASGSGFRWLTSGSFSAPIPLYGIALLKSDSSVLYGVQQFATPIIVNQAGQQVDVDPVQMTFVLQPLS